MDQTTLVSPGAQRAGKELIAGLTRSGMLIEAALWLYDAERGSPKLILATAGAEIDLYGEYLKVSTLLLNDRTLAKSLSSSDVQIVAPSNKIVRLLSEGVGKPVHKLTRWERSTINGTIIEDALIYRLAA